MHIYIQHIWIAQTKRFCIYLSHTPALLMRVSYNADSDWADDKTLENSKRERERERER